MRSPAPAYDDISHIDYVFVETVEGEADAAWERAVVGMLGLNPERIPPFAAGPTVAYAGRFFRSMRTIAGSMHAFLIVGAERGRLPRALILIASGGATAWIDGQKVEFDEQVIESQLPARKARRTTRLARWLRGRRP
jgi:hypothetical protein